MYLSQQQLAQINTFFRDKPVKKVYLFGSYADGDATEESDIDLLIESQKDFDYLQFRLEVDGLSNQLKKKIDIVSINALRPDRYFTKNVLEQKVMLYEKD
jgi:uncharacterized protein